MPDSAPAIVLLSGGMDSATVLAIAIEQGYATHALSFRYGQRHAIELDAARRIAAAMGTRSHRIIDIDLAQFGGSALTTDSPVPRDRADHEIGKGVPPTYVPARNTIFLGFALAHAEVTGAHDIFIGVNAVDYSGYPDCRPEYIAAFESAARLGSRIADLTIHAPLAHLTKAAIIKRGIDLAVDYGLTRTCYDPDGDGWGCGHCDACGLRLRAFEELGMTDPAPYQSRRRRTE